MNVIDDDIKGWRRFASSSIIIMNVIDDDIKGWRRFASSFIIMNDGERKERRFALPPAVSLKKTVAKQRAWVAVCGIGVAINDLLPNASLCTILEYSPSMNMVP